MKKRVIFRGKRIEVWMVEAKVEDVVRAEGLEVRADGYYKDGKKIVITSRPFRPAWPRLVGNLSGGSVCWVRDGHVATNYHVAAYTNTLEVTSSESYPVAWREMYKPTTYNPLEFIIRYYLLRWIGLGPRYSRYDYAVGDVGTTWTTPWPDATIIFFAGNCTSRDEKNCIGLALPRPDAPDPGESIIDRRYKMYCTYWDFGTGGTILDRGEASVVYPGGIALFDDAYALSFDGDNGIPGCSGSPIWISNT